MPNPAPDRVLAVVAPSPLRRLVGVAVLLALGGLLVWTAFATPPANVGWQVVLIATGGAALWLADRVRRATRHRVELTETELRDSSGRVLAPVTAVRAVESGVFAFKPSNGFMIRLSEAAPGAWAPGLWWRFGRRVGIGGVTPSYQAKFMAETLRAMLDRRRL